MIVPDAVLAAYDRFADVYDRHWGAMMTAPVLRMVEEHLIGQDKDAATPATVLDLCCGTGQLAAALLANGHAVVGVDGSAAMLAHAARRAPEAVLLHQDVRQLQLDQPVDAVVSAFDSLNHLPDVEDFRATMQRVFACMRPGAGFLFDLNTEEGFRERFADDFSITEDNLVLTARGGFDGEVGSYRIAWLSPEERTSDEVATGRVWRRYDVELAQRCFPREVVLAALHDAGFLDVRTFDAVADVGMAGHVGRRFYLARVPA